MVNMSCDLFPSAIAEEAASNSEKSSKKKTLHAYTVQSEAAVPNGRKLRAESSRQFNSKSRINAVISSYVKMASNFLTKEVNGKTYLFYKKDGRPTGISLGALMRIIDTALRHKLSQPLYFKVKGIKSPFIAKIEARNLQLFHISKKIGSGCFSEVYEVSALHLGKRKALKIAHYSREMSDEEIADKKLHVAKDFAILNAIHEENKVCGIQAKPLLAFNGGYIGKIYECDYFDVIKNIDEKPIPLECTLLSIYQVLFGLQYMASLGIVHGDIKLENLFVKEKGGCQFVYLGDWGGARHIHDSTAEWDEMGIHTRDYLALRDVKKFYELIELYDSEADPEARAAIEQNFIQLHQKRDVFAAGACFHLMLSEGYPPYLVQKVWIKEGKIFLELSNTEEGYQDLPPDLPEEVRNLVKDMLAPNPEDRPTFQEAYERFHRYIQPLCEPKRVFNN